MNSFFTSSMIRGSGDDDESEDYATPPWLAPPETVLGAVVPIGRLVFQGPNVVIALTHASAYPSGVTLHVRIVARRGDLPDETWWDLEHGFFGGPPRPRPGRGGDGLPDSLCRYGVQFPDGVKATTISEDAYLTDDEPSGPVLISAGGGGGSGSDSTLESSDDLWLWPLPPPEPFDFVVEWPVAGVPETRLRLDGTQIADAASRAIPFWAEPPA